MKILNWKKIIPYIASVLIFIIVSLTYFSPVLEGKQLRQSDIINYKGSVKEIEDYKALTGEEVLWTNSMFGGMPAYQISVYYHTNVVPFFNKLFKLWLPHPAGLLFVLFIGFFILLAVLRVNPWLAAAGALAFGFSTYFFAFIEVGHNAKVLAIGYMPAVLAGVILAYRGRILAGAALTALFMALELTVNHVQITYYLLFILAAVVIAEFVWALIKKQFLLFLKASGALLAAGIIALGPNVAPLWTNYEYMKETIRGKSELTTDQSNKSGGLDKDYITQWSYGTGETFTLLIPDAKGGASGRLAENKGAMNAIDRRMKESVGQQNTYWGNMPFTSGTVYAGAFIVFLFLLGLMIVRDRLKWALLGITVLGILLAWGHNLYPLTEFFVDYVPFYNKFRAVSTLMVIACMSLPLLATMTIKEIIDRKDEFRQIRRYFFIAAGFTLGLLLLFWLFPKGFFNFFSAQELTYFDSVRGQGVDESQLDAFMDNLETARLHIFKMSALRSILFVVLGAGLIWLYGSMKKMSRYLLIAGVALIVLIDLVPLNRRYINSDNFVTPRQNESVFAPTAANEFILKDTDPSYRVMNVASSNFTTEAFTSYYHKSLGGYHAAKLRRYQELIEHRLLKEREQLVSVLQSQPTDSALMANMYTLSAFNMLNTRYYIINPEGRPLRNPAALGNAWFVRKIETVENADEEIRAIDRFYPGTTAIVDKRFENEIQGLKEVSSTGGAKIELQSYSPDHLVYKVSGVKEKMLAVFSEVYYDKGWVASIDGTPVNHIRANYVLRALVVPEGDHTIEFDFHPRAFYTGKQISLAGSILLLLLLAAAAFVEIRKSFKKKSQA